MKKLSGEQGVINVLLIPMILLAALFIGAASFAVWAFNSRQDYKNNTQAKVDTAVNANTKAVRAQDAKQYAESYKQPLKSFTGPDAYGSVHIMYPKTWSAYIDTTTASKPLDAYFHTDTVPSLQSKQTYNLRVQVASETYSQSLQRFSSSIKTGKVIAAPYTLPKVPDVTGTILTGQVLSGGAQAGTGTLIMLPLRSTTLEVWTESPNYLPDFNTYILPNLSFLP